jgi:hypothetical protein
MEQLKTTNTITKLRFYTKKELADMYKTTLKMNKTLWMICSNSKGFAKTKNGLFIIKK